MPNPTGSYTIVLRAHFPAYILASLVSCKNPKGKVTNNKLYMAVSLFHHECMAKFFDVKERTTRARTDNITGLLCQNKGSAKAT